MSKVVFVPNPNFKAEVMASAGVASALQVSASAVAASASALAPVDEGDYAASISGAVAPADTGPAQATGARFVGRVDAKDYKAVWLEFGTGNPAPTPAFAPLRRGAEAAGFIVIGGRG